MIGAMATQGHADVGDLELPAESHYQKIWDIIDRQRKALVYPNKQDPDVTARNVVHDILGGRSSYIWRGASASVAWFCTAFLPRGLFTSMINGDKGLKVVAEGRR